MKIAIVGAGIIGACTALRLAQDGHQVSLFDAKGSVAEGASFANAGVIAPGYVTPWASPGMPSKVLRQLFRDDAAVKFSLRMERAQWRWIIHWLAACKPVVYTANRSAMQQLALHSQQLIHVWRDHYGFEYEQAQGYLQLLRSERDLQLVQPSLDVLKSLNHAHHVIDEAACRKLEPYLSTHTPIHAAVHLPKDEVGNCRYFAQQARDAATALGAAIRMRENITAIEPAAQHITLHIGQQSEQFDHVVVCAGMDSKALLRPLGIRLPMQAVWGYSVSAPIKDLVASPFQAEVSGIAGVMDEQYKVSITRLGNRLRVAGIAELGAKPGEVNELAVNTLYKVLRDWFPSSADLKHAQVWMGARPMMPDGPPVIGPSKVPRLWLNTGHGSSGWALAAGSADLLADLVMARVSQHPATAYSASRYNA